MLLKQFYKITTKFSSSATTFGDLPDWYIRITVTDDALQEIKLAIVSDVDNLLDIMLLIFHVQGWTCIMLNVWRYEQPQVVI